MKVHRRVVGPLDTNCYIVEDRSSKEAIIIDPGGDGQKLLDFVSDLKLNVRYVVLTHGHLDHIMDAGFIQSKTSAPVMVSETDSSFLDDPGWMRNIMDTSGMSVVKDRVFIKEGDIVSFGESNLRVIQTPGHSAGSISLYWDGKKGDKDLKDNPGALFSGDVIFRLSIGRADFPGSDPDLLIATIQNKIMTLPGDTVIYPGHGIRTTVDKERKENPFLT